VERSILALDTQKGPDPDGISPLLLKKIVLVVKKPLDAVFFTCRCFLGFFQAVIRYPFVQEW
jgi:hypothetical protein